jgi:hypothetical protein
MLFFFCRKWSKMNEKFRKMDENLRFYRLYGEVEWLFLESSHDVTVTPNYMQRQFYWYLWQTENKTGCKQENYNTNLFVQVGSRGEFATQKLMLSCSLTCHQSHHIHFPEFRHTVLLLKSDLDNSISLWGGFAEHSKPTLSNTTKCEQNQISHICKFGHI